MMLLKWLLLKIHLMMLALAACIKLKEVKDSK